MCKSGKHPPHKLLRNKAQAGQSQQRAHGAEKLHRSAHPAALWAPLLYKLLYLVLSCSHEVVWTQVLGNGWDLAGENSNSLVVHPSH